LQLTSNNSICFIGDVATGEGVKRHFFSLVMHKLQNGFLMDFEDQRAAVNQLALSWDLPVLTQANHVWLLHSLLQHAVSSNNQNFMFIKKGISLLW
uniref:HECT domain-containing protein n=1 Tax=Sander lucioperca TaxID=283035 RepID=A0A8C9XTU4_SANLU